MRLQSKATVIILATFAVLLAIAFIAARAVIPGSFARLERKLTTESLARAVDTLHYELDKLKRFTSDWGAWDDTYIFIDDGNEAYKESNLVDSTFVEAELNLMMFIAATGQVVMEKGFDLEEEEESPVPGGLRRHLTAGGELTSFKDTSSYHSGIILLNEGSLMIITHPIVTSEHMGPIKGTLVMGRFLNEKMMNQLSRLTRLTLSIRRWSDTGLNRDFRDVKSDLYEDRGPVTRIRDRETIAGYAMLEDIYGEPALILKAEGPREIFARGMADFYFFILMLAASGLVIALVSLLLLRWQVLSRLIRLIEKVRGIGASRNLSDRVSVPGTDELSLLAEEINRMLEALESSDESLRKAYDDLENQNLELRKLDELKDSIIHSVSHELRTPVAKHAMQMEILRSYALKAECPGEIKGALSVMGDNIKRQESAIRNILTLTQIEAGVREYRREPINLASVIRMALEDYREALDSKNIAVETQLIDKTVESDREMLWHVFSNLISNAVKYRSRTEPPVMVITMEEAGGEMVVRISDNGLGMTPGEIKKAFERFYQASTSAQGIGMGLAISRKISEGLGGRIWLESEGKGKGTTAVVALPHAE